MDCWHLGDARGILMVMPSQSQPAPIPDERISIEKRGDQSLVVRVRSEGPEGGRLPDAVFSFRCGDPQYAYWLGRLEQIATPRRVTPPANSQSAK
jgi:hypothetical protein